MDGLNGFAIRSLSRGSLSFIQYSALQFFVGNVSYCDLDSVLSAMHNKCCTRYLFVQFLKCRD